MRLRPRMKRRTERGASAVEFALVVPILVLVLAGIVNFGFVLAQQISLNNGARQAARFAVVDGPTCGQVQAEGQDSAATIGMTSTQVPTPVIARGQGATYSAAPCPKPCAASNAGDNIRVTMTRTSASNPWVISFPPFNLLPAPTLVGTGVMRCEFS
jgi:Flp pilus assembly protein TadG